MDADDVHERWADRSRAYSPEYYAYYGPNETSELLRHTLEDEVDADASILEVGCSSGRHLAHLFEHGFEDLHGIEINEDALEVMADTYPDLADAGTFYVDALERVVPEFDDGRFDVVFSVETLQHVHPDNEWVFSELLDATDTLLVTVENEGDDECRETANAAENRESSDASGNGTNADADGSEDALESDGDAATDDIGAGSSAREVRNVDGVPLYVRDWERVFAGRDAEQIAVESLERDTFRAFRPTAE